MSEPTTYELYRQALRENAELAEGNARAEARVRELEAENERLRAELNTCEQCGHLQAEPNWCQECGHRPRMQPWAHAFLKRIEDEKAEQESLYDDVVAERDELWVALEWLKDNAHDEEALSERAACDDPFHTEQRGHSEACPACSSTWWALDGSLPFGAAYAVEAVARAALLPAPTDEDKP